MMEVQASMIYFTNFSGDVRRLHVSGWATSGIPRTDDDLHQIPGMEGQNEHRSHCTYRRPSRHRQTRINDLTRKDVTGINTGRSWSSRRVCYIASVNDTNPSFPPNFPCSLIGILRSFVIIGIILIQDRQYTIISVHINTQSHIHRHTDRHLLWF